MEENPNWYPQSALPPPQPEPPIRSAFAKFIDYSPDHNPSASVTITTTINGRLMRFVHVRGLGFIVQQADTSVVREDGALTFNGAAIITKTEVGFAPDI